MVKENYIKKSRGLSLFSGGLDSQLAVKVLQRAGAHVEAITFVTPFFSPDTAMGMAGGHPTVGAAQMRPRA